MEYNGAAIIGMCGDGCVGIAADSRYGIQQMTVGTNMKKIFKVAQQHGLLTQPPPNPPKLIQ